MTAAALILGGGAAFLALALGYALEIARRSSAALVARPLDAERNP